MGDIDIDKLDAWLTQLTHREDVALLRMKGLLAVPGQHERFVFHGVRHVIDVQPERPWGDEARRTHIVFIGRGLNEAELRAGFLACMYANEGE